ncbi:MASE3 domain-containing protein [Trichlorobacter lovleyi]|uniref:histidine kinase n=1 Tax=Trichlorobacter lovleyi (strain ATCC BAA-1151 / DSM 17278 / SZ) TaxID=398767 RepID=B3EA45_TRIL1|nr:MASE3 domain-containing protein [Trichlorobacter lovleyi]ACD93873.1 multi-sensor signal transduction histidine kinase [Trichlorobacter lovleyi SZ]
MYDTAGSTSRSLLLKGALFSIFTVLLYLIAQRDYLVFHSFAELFSIVIACGIFMLAWNSRAFYDNNYLLFIGITYLFVAFFDTLHTLAYRGTGIFTSFDHNNLAPQLWLVARYLESIALLTAPLFFRRRLQITGVFLLAGAVSVLALWSIFWARNFPDCFISGLGLTPFKCTSEYLIVLILAAALALLYREKAHFEPNVLRLLTLSISCTIITELFFTIYTDLYGVFNFVGHIFKILSFGFMYKAIIETALRQPYSLLFRELKQSEETLRQKEESLLLAQRLAHMGSWEWNLHDNSMWWSDEMYALFDYDKQQTTACLERIFERVHPDDMPAVQQATAAYLQEKQPLKFSHRIIQRDGSVHHLQVEFNRPRRDQRGTALLAVGIVHDITDQVQAAKMREDIELITHHDLKTPLNPVIGIPEILLMDANLTPEQTELIQMIKTCGYRILNIIDSSLSLYKMEQGTYTLTTTSCNLLQLIHEIARGSEQQLTRKQLKLTCLIKGAPAGPDDLFMVPCEELLCYTMLSNLISNAVEASPPGADITVSCEQDALWSSITIHNQGAVPVEIRASFFDRYVTHGKQKGTGLGTYSALLAARTHHGDISMTTSEEGGTFSLRCACRTTLKQHSPPRSIPCNPVTRISSLSVPVRPDWEPPFSSPARHPVFRS